MLIPLRQYAVTNTLDNEVECLESFMEGDGFISEAISEIADDHTPSESDDIWLNVPTLKKHIERAIAEGLAPVHDESETNLEAIFQSGYYLFYIDLMYGNLHTLAYNYIVTKVNAVLSNFNYDNENFNFHELTNMIAGESVHIVPSMRYDDIDSIADVLISQIRNGHLNINIR